MTADRTPADCKLLDRLFGNALGRLVGTSVVLGAGLLAPTCVERLVGQEVQQAQPTEEINPAYGLLFAMPVIYGLHRLQRKLEEQGRGSSIDERMQARTDRGFNVLLSMVGRGAKHETPTPAQREYPLSNVLGADSMEQYERIIRQPDVHIWS